MSIRKLGLFAAGVSMAIAVPAPASAGGERDAQSPSRPTSTQFSEPTRPNEPNPIEGQPDWVISGTGKKDSTTAAALVCTGSTYCPDITTGGPGQYFITASASQQCSGGTFYQELCAKVQRNSGGLDPYWFDVTNWQCNTNTGPSIYATATKDCATTPRAVYRTGARGKATPVGTGLTQTRYGYSAGETLC